MNLLLEHNSLDNEESMIQGYGEKIHYTKSHNEIDYENDCVNDYVNDYENDCENDYGIS